MKASTNPVLRKIKHIEAAIRYKKHKIQVAEKMLAQEEKRLDKLKNYAQRNNLT